MSNEKRKMKEMNSNEGKKMMGKGQKTKSFTKGSKADKTVK